MRRFFNCCFTRETAADLQEPSDTMASTNAADDCLHHEKSNDESKKPLTNIIQNHDFSSRLDQWNPNCCKAFVASQEIGSPREPPQVPSGPYAVLTDRKESWQGLEQDITDRILVGPTYTVSAWVRIASQKEASASVQATLKLESHDSSVSYLFIGRTCASKEHWEKLEGTFSLSNRPRRATFYLEGPPPGVDLLLRSVVVSCNDDRQNLNRPKPAEEDEENIVQNPQFDDGLKNWSGRGCNIVLRGSASDGKILPASGKFFASTENRTQTWNGIQQEITGRVQRKRAYEVVAAVRVYGNNVNSTDLRATLWVQSFDLREQYISIGSVKATDRDWVQLQGKFLLNASPSRAVIYLEGPPPGTDILLNKMVVKRASKPPPSFPPETEDVAFGVNILANSNLSDGTNGFFPLGNCTLTVANGSPHILPSMARDSLGPHEPLSGRCILVANRTQTWMGPAQTITDKIKLFVTYQVSAWVRIGGGRVAKPQGVNVALGVDGQWVNGGQVEVDDDKWHEIGGSFRIEKQFGKVMVYVQGPDPGLDLMVAGFQIFAVDRHARFRHLKNQTEMIRKRDVVLNFTSSDPAALAGTFVRIKQTQNSFPLGSCMNRSQIDNEDFVDFFCNNFNWSVFGNELKWYWTEPQQGNLNYRDADEMLSLCSSRGIRARGHCIFWEVESTVQPWIRALSRTDLARAVQSRLTGLLTRYKGKFEHYDVNNEMLHGSFYRDRLGKDVRAQMFKTAHELDPSALLFVNDYHVEDGADSRSSPEKYVNHVLDLQQQGAPVGGIGVQGHIDSPVGPVVCSALDKLGILGLPVWFTELDVSSSNEYVRAEDLEVMLREAYAHPAVEGVMLWGFWELFMSRENAHLVDAEGEVNVAGKRFLELKREWLSEARGVIDERCRFEFRGFHGSYEIEVIGFRSNEFKVVKTFVVDPGQDPLSITINL